MSTFDYAGLQADIAERLIIPLGKQAWLRPDDGGADVPVTAIVLDYGSRERDGALIQADDRRALLLPIDTTPDPEKFQFVVDGTEFRIVSTRIVRPAETILYFDCQIRA